MPFCIEFLRERKKETSFRRGQGIASDVIE